jgi:phage terminase small subunit
MGEPKTLKFTDEQKELASVLTSMQRAFVVNLIGGLSQRQAVKEAGSKAKTENALDQVASIMFSNVKVRALYDSLLESKYIANKMTREEALSILSSNARVKMTDVADYKFVQVGETEEGEPIMQTVWTMKDSKDIDPEKIACIKSVTMTKQGPKIELHDQQGAIKQISAMEGWDAAKRAELTGANGAPLAIKADVNAPEIAEALLSIANMIN